MQQYTVHLIASYRQGWHTAALADGAADVLYQLWIPVSEGATETM